MAGYNICHHSLCIHKGGGDLPRWRAHAKPLALSEVVFIAPGAATPRRPILYYTILYYTILYYTILYYTILYYTLL